MKISKLIELRKQEHPKDTVFTYTDKTNLEQLELAARLLLLGLLKLKEDFNWLENCKKHKWASIKDASDYYNDTYDGYKRHLKDYEILLKEYLDNHNFYEDKSLQDKFLNGEILKVREFAERGIIILNNIMSTSKDVDVKNDIQKTIDDSREIINAYLEILREILRKDIKLQNWLLTIGIDYRVKYNLNPI